LLIKTHSENTMLTALAIINMAVAAVLINDTDVEDSALTTVQNETTEIVATASNHTDTTE